MKFVYLVCLVTLLQVSTCLPTGETTESTVETSTEESPVVETEANDTVAFESTVMDVSNGTDTTPTTTDDEVVDTGPYAEVTDSSSSSTVVEEESSSTTTASPGHAALVHPTAFAIIVPVCIHMFSKLAGGV